MIFLGSFSAMEINATPVDASDVEKIEITNGIYDELYVDSNIDMEYSTEIPEWGYSTILDAKFKGNLLAGNVDFTLDSISGMFIKKRKFGDYKWTTIHYVPIQTEEDFDFYYNDIVVASQTQYQYAAVPIVNNAEGTYQTISVDVCYDGCFIIDPTYGYQVIGELKRSSLSRKIPVNVIETVHSPYPYIHYYSESKYDQFTISGWFVERDKKTFMFDSLNGWKYREAVRAFLSNRRCKIVKWYDGQIYMACVTSDVAESEGSFSEHVTTSIQFTQVGDVNSNADLYKHGFVNYLEVGV